MLTSKQLLLCCLGLRKNVPSTNGYLSKTSMGVSQSTQATRDICIPANVDKMKHRVSSLPWLPSSSICNKKKQQRVKMRVRTMFLLTIKWKQIQKFLTKRKVIKKCYQNSIQNLIVESSPKITIRHVWSNDVTTDYIFLFHWLIFLARKFPATEAKDPT